MLKEENEEGSASNGDIGWTCGVWSIEEGVSLLPKNLINGVRSACAPAAAARRALVANILLMELKLQ